MIEKDLKSLQIDREKKQSYGSSRGTRWIVLSAILGLLLLAALAYLYVWEQPTPAAVNEETPPAANGRQNASDGALSDTLIVPGYVVAHHKIQLGSKVMGKVGWIGVEKGDRVEKGQLLVKLDDREYRARVDEAEATQRAAEARLSELERGYRREEIERSSAELARAEADRKNAAADIPRLEMLFKNGVISQKALDDGRARLEMAEAAVKAAEQNYELMKIGPRSEQIALARAEVDRAKANLRYSQTLFEATEIRAPISGTVLQRLVEVGEMVTTSFAGEMGAKSAVVALADLDDLQVELDISQGDFKRISRDQECIMSPEAYPDREYPCQIAEIAPEANRQKATIQVKVRILKPDEFLRPEMNARVTFRKKQS